MTGPFEMVGDPGAAVCVDGVCVLPATPPPPTPTPPAPPTPPVADPASAAGAGRTPQVEGALRP